MEKVIGYITDKSVPGREFRWENGFIEVRSTDGRLIKIWLLGVIVQWLNIGDKVRIEAEKIFGEISGESVRIYKLIEYSKSSNKVEEVLIWPLYEKRYEYPRLDPVKGEVLYTYRIIAREARTERDYMDIVELEQYHYASKKELVALWKLPDGRIVESNIQPECKEGKAELVAIKGSLPASRFLVLELAVREAFEPRIVGYVRIDPPVPAMHRRIIKNGKVIIERDIRSKVFPREWIYPTYWPERLMKKLAEQFKELSEIHGRRMAYYMLSEKVREEALRTCNTAAARIARVVIHPDYRGDGLGMFAVKAAIEWIRERRIPEMRKKKHLVETIAMMAKYHPFFERVGFKYLWDTASGRPVLYYPLTSEAEKIINNFLTKDPYAKKHGGKLYRSRYKVEEPIEKPIIFKDISKMYSSELDISALHEDLQEVLRAFGVVRRVVQRYVLRNVNLEINPGEVVVVVGISGAGKTTFLRMIIGEALKIRSERYMPTSGKIIVPKNIRVSALLPGEIEPKFEEESLLEHMYNKIGDIVAAIEVLNISGLTDAVFYRARFRELSTGQKERAKIASLLAEKPNVLIIDEFTAHLDVLTAQRVARKISSIARKNKITLIVATNRPEVLKALAPDKILYVGYGSIMVKK